jgi:hypothetical protein
MEASSIFGAVSPFVTGKYLGQFIGRPVTLVGEVAGAASGAGLPVRCADGAVVTVQLPPGESVERWVCLSMISS